MTFEYLQMMLFHSGHYLLPAGLVVLMSGCASFNDTLTIDIGDQFALLNLERMQGQALQREPAVARGFECDFNAHSMRVSLFGRERNVSGTIRCRALENADPAGPGPANSPLPSR